MIVKRGEIWLAELNPIPRVRTGRNATSLNSSKQFHQPIYQHVSCYSSNNESTTSFTTYLFTSIRR
jgi:hypothetical protein